VTDELYRQQFLPDLLVAALERNGQRACLVMDDRTLTAHEMRDEISRYVQAYRALGVPAGSGSAILAKNRPEVLVAMGTYMVFPTRNTPLHPLGSLDDHAYVLEDAGIETLVFDPAFAERARHLQERSPSLRLLSLGPCDVGVDVVALARTFEPEPLLPPTVDAEDSPTIAYTGGTTGRPKGVLPTYRSSGAMAHMMTTEWPWPEEVRHLVCTPLSHAGGSFFVPILLRGGSLVVIPQFEAGAVLDAIERHRITTVMLVPSMIYALLDHPSLDGRDLSSLQTVFYGASPISPTRLQEAIRRLGPIFFQFYGQTECPQTLCTLRQEDHDPDDLERLSTCGRPVPWVRVALLDDDGKPVPKGEPGELCVRGPLVMKGYWNRPEETAQALAGGWLHTGDVARQDEHGFLTIVDRKKDMIVSGGFNVFPREVEDVIGTHPAVATVGVVGVPDERWGEAVKAVVVLRSGATVEPEELIALVKDKKGSHYAPKSIDVVDALPMTSVGKPDKKALRARYWGDSGRMVN
jgi:fatty-acyl-CoA synthase